MLTRLILARPRLAFMISLVIVLAGLLTLPRLPLTEYPDVTPPNIKVTAFYPGASAAVIECSVTTPLEEAINGVPDMLYMNSTSASDGTMTLNVYFNIGTDPDKAEHHVQARVDRTRHKMPPEVINTGITVQKALNTQLAYVNFFSPDHSRDTTFLASYLKLNIIDELRRQPAIGDAYTIGRQQYSMRIWLDPIKMANANISVDDVSQAINAQNRDLVTGHIGQSPSPRGHHLEYVIETDGRFELPEQFERIVLKRTDKGILLRLSDVARVELGAESFGTIENMDSGASSNLMVYLEPGANALDASRYLHKTLQRLARDFPPPVSVMLSPTISACLLKSPCANWRSLWCLQWCL